MLYPIVRFGISTGVACCARKVATNVVKSVASSDEKLAGKIVSRVGEFAIVSALSSAACKWAKSACDDIKTGYQCTKAINDIKKSLEDIAVKFASDEFIDTDYFNNYIDKVAKQAGKTKDELFEEYPAFKDVLAMGNQCIAEHNEKAKAGSKVIDVEA